MTIAEGEYAGLNPYALINPGMTLTPGFADFAFTPWDDMNLTYLSTEGDVVGDMSTLVTGVAYNEYTYASLNITTTDLVNVEDPDDQLLLSVGDNLESYNPILVGEDKIKPNETLGYGNEPIITLAGEHEYIYIDNYGSAEDFAKVKDVLAGNIAVCNRGGISFYLKANAAVENGAIGIIIVNNQSGSVNMNITGYEYDKPAVSITPEEGALLKSNATYVDGDAPYYRGTLTISEDLAYKHSDLNYSYGYVQEDVEREIRAVVQDWTKATPGATYQATINYTAILYTYDLDHEVWAEPTNEHATTTLTVTIPDDTAIEVVNADKSTEGRTYNLMGMPVGKSYKGIVIKNGRKVLQ